MKKKLRQYEIYKLPTNRFVRTIDKKLTIEPLVITKREALENGELVKVQSNQLTNKIFDYFMQSNIPGTKLDMSELIVNIVVPPERKKAGEREYKALAEAGFVLNGRRYVRLYSGSGQIRRNTITFIREDLYQPVFTSLLCGLSPEDFGDSFNAAKFNAYAGLNMSGCHLLPDELAPKVCVVDDFEQIRPHTTVNYVTEQRVQYITLPDIDFVLTNDQTEFDIVDDKAVRKSDGMEFTIRTGIQKNIASVPYDEIPSSPNLNSFDGQGLMSPAWAEKVSAYLGYDYLPSEMIIRAPWVKGLLANVPFHQFFAEHGITTITDFFGKIRPIEEIDILLSKSQFKMCKVYKAKCAGSSVNAWDYYTQSMRDNHLKWGVVKPNAKSDDHEKALNYQYLQALQLSNTDIEALCLQTQELLLRLNSGNLEEVYASLVVNNKGFSPETDDDCSYKKLFQKVLEANPALIDDKYIRSLVLKECTSKMNGAKLGELLIRGNFQFCVSDPLAQLQWIAHNHCNSDIEITGIVPAGSVYSNYWLDAEDGSEEIVLMRSPLIDRNEIAKRTVMAERNDYFRFLRSGIVYSIHDLTPLQQGGCDYDGDIVFSTNNDIISRGCYSYEDAKPLYYELTSTHLVGTISQENIILADIRGLNSDVGTISNKGGSLYAMLERYNPDSTEYRKIYDSIIALGQIVGMEIDRIKTAVSPTFPLEWDALQATSRQTRQMTEVKIVSEDERKGIYRHNELVPDIKPYYFRYNYEYLNRSILQLDNTFNEVTVKTYGVKLPDFIVMCESGNATEEMMKLYRQYRRSYPVIDTDCVVNHVCHYFENFEKSIRKTVISEGRNMLKDFVSEAELDTYLVEKVKRMLLGYQRFKRLAVKSYNTNPNCNNKKVKESAYHVLDMMRNYYREETLAMTNRNYQLAFDYLVTASTNETTVWEIMDFDILKIIRRGQCV